MIKVVQTWEENLDSKTGWISDGWFYDDTGEEVDEEDYSEIEVTDTDKFFNPIEGIIQDNE